MSRSRNAFTLVEILIVVIILGILAIVVIPQFSSASTDAKTSSLTSTLQTFRNQLELYKLQHNDTYPSSAANLITVMTVRTNQAGTTGTDPNLFPYRPYMQAFPTNPFVNSSAVASGGTAGNGSTAGWWYDPSTGKFCANDSAHVGL